MCAPAPSPLLEASRAVALLALLAPCAAGCGRHTAGGRSSSSDGGAPTAGLDLGAGSGGASGAPATHVATFSTLGTEQYLSATNGGGSTLTAAAPAPRAWETFTLVDLDGAPLRDGDLVRLAAGDGHWLSAAGGGGGALTVDAAAPAGDETFRVTRLAGPGTIAAGDAIALATRLGNYVSASDGGGGDVRADAPAASAWETFTLSLDGDVGGPAGSARAQVLALLASIRGQQTIAGQHNKHNDTPADATQQVASITGKSPALWSGDFLFGAVDVGARPQMIAEAIDRWRHGAMVQLMYHNCIPTRDELCSWDDIGGNTPQHLTDAQWAELVTDHTPLDDAWLTRLDKLAVFFRQLETAGVAPLFRPLHEMNQARFWWGGRGGADGTRKLFQITHDFLVHTKGFTNIIWVWDVQDFATLSSDVADYDPGAGYFDIAALDVYDGGYTQANYDLLRGAAAGKPIAIGECEHLPTSAELNAQPEWAFFMLWPDFIGEDTSVLPTLYAAPNVLTGEHMPGWK
jgi:mannan endo-1,4-beta-mannosidase